VSEKLVPVFTSEELSALEKTCQGRSFAQRRGAAIIAVLTAAGIRAGELAGIRYDPHDPRRSGVDLWRREITVRGKGGRARVVRIGHEAAGALDLYLRVRSGHPQAWRPQLWLGVNNRGPMTANGIYQMIAYAHGRPSTGLYGARTLFRSAHPCRTALTEASRFRRFRPPAALTAINDYAELSSLYGDDSS
jgi:site-specific recombinase XerD